MGAGADAGATKGVLGDAGTACDSERGGMADGRASVPEVLAPAELEGFLAGFVPEALEPACGASVGEEVEEAQELAMDPTRGADDARQEGVGDTRPQILCAPMVQKKRCIAVLFVHDAPRGSVWISLLKALAARSCADVPRIICWCVL